MNQIVVAPEALDRSHELTAVERWYAEVLATRIAAADRGEFASETEVARFFAEHGT